MKTHSKAMERRRPLSEVQKEVDQRTSIRSVTGRSIEVRGVSNVVFQEGT
jgi:hypothetical protein